MPFADGERLLHLPGLGLVCWYSRDLPIPAQPGFVQHWRRLTPFYRDGPGMQLGDECRCLRTGSRKPPVVRRPAIDESGFQGSIVCFLFEFNMSAWNEHRIGVDADSVKKVVPFENEGCACGAPCLMNEDWSIEKALFFGIQRFFYYAGLVEPII